MTCLEAEPLLSWHLDGEAPEVDAHLRDCAACRAKLEKLREADALLAAVARRAPEAPSRAERILAGVRSRARRRWLPLAAAALLAVGFGGLTVYMNARTADPQEVRLFGSRAWVADTTGVLRVVVRDALRRRPVAGAAVRASLGGAETEAVSGADGSAEIRLPASAGRLVVEIRSEAGYDRLEEDIRVERPVRLFLSTDKPMYQPSQTIHLRALAMGAFSGKPWTGELDLEVADPNGNRVFRKTLPTGEFGIASADLPLADELVFGTWRVKVAAGGATSERTVEVKRYVLPKFRVDLRTERGWYGPGETVKGTLEAAYTFGKPVAGASARVELSAWSVDRFRAFATAEARTDAEGRSVFEAKLPDRLFGTELARGDAVIRVEAAVVDGAAHEERKAVALTVTPAPLRVAVFPEGGDYVRGLTEQLHAVASYADGSPAQVTIEIDGRRWETDAAGVALLPLRRESFTLTARDARGLTLEKKVQLSDFAGDQDFVLRTDKSEYRGGETLTASLLSTTDGTIYVDLVKGGQTLLTKSVDVRKGRGSVAVDLPAELSGTLRLTAYRVSLDGSVGGDTRLVLVEAPADLQIRPKLAKAEFKPGEEIDVEFEVLGADGKPAVAALGLAVVDEAIFALHESRPGLEKTFFRIEEDLLTPRGQLYPSAASLPLPLRLEAAPDVPVGPIQTSWYSSKQEALEESTREFNETAGTLVAWTLGLGALAGILWGIISLGSSPAGIAIRMAGILILLMLVAAALLPMGAKARFAPRMSSRAEEGWVLTAPMPRPSPSEVSVPEPAKSDGKPAAPRIREYFPETLYWNPQLITDARGRARATFPGADSITTWRMAMSAVSRDGRLGGGESGVRVFQPFFVDLDLPLALTQGDEAWLPVAVYNYLKEAQTVRLSLEAESGLEVVGDREKAVDVKPGETTSVRFHVRARQFGTHKLLVKAVGPAFSDALRRAIEVLPDGKEIPLSAGDRVGGRAVVRIPAEAVDGPSRLWVRLYPSMFSEIVTGLEGLVRMPYGCFEQTSSVTYPNVLVMDYLQRAGKLTPEWRMKLEAAINAGWQRILSFEAKGGGFDWYAGGTARTMLTAYGVLELTDMDKVYPIDREVIQRAMNLLWSRQGADGAWALDVPVHTWSQVGDGRLPITAYVTWALGEAGVKDGRLERGRAWIRANAGKAVDPYVRALVALAVGGEALGAVERDAQLRGDQAVWETKGEGLYHARGTSASIEATALAALALQKEDRSPLIDKALSTLARSRDAAGSWGSTQATILSIKALLGASKAVDEKKSVPVKLFVNGREVPDAFQPIGATDVVQQVEIPAAEGETVVEVKAEARASFQVTGRCYLPWALAPEPAEPPLAIRVAYDRETLKLGERVKATATLVYGGPGRPAVIADLGVPPGFTPDAAAFEALVRKGAIDKFSITGRQIILYIGSLEKGRRLEIEYELVPRFPIRARTPGSGAYEYYTPENRGSGKPSTLRVLEEF